jgi:hypothetical protein
MDNSTRQKSKVLRKRRFFLGSFLLNQYVGFDDDLIRVLFVEYGNEQMCAFDELRPMCAYQIGDEVEAKFAVDDQVVQLISLKLAFF